MRYYGSPTRPFTYHRGEQRILMEVPVILDGHRRLPGTESTFTENVSARARAWSVCAAGNKAKN